MKISFKNIGKVELLTKKEIYVTKNKKFLEALEKKFEMGSYNNLYWVSADNRNDKSDRLAIINKYTCFVLPLDEISMDKEKIDEIYNKAEKVTVDKYLEMRNIVIARKYLNRLKSRKEAGELSEKEEKVMNVLKRGVKYFLDDKGWLKIDKKGGYIYIEDNGKRSPFIYNIDVLLDKGLFIKADISRYRKPSEEK